MLPIPPTPWERHTYVTAPLFSELEGKLRTAYLSGEEIVEGNITTRVTGMDLSAYEPTMEKQVEVVFQLWQRMEVDDEPTSTGD